MTSIQEPRRLNALHLPCSVGYASFMATRTTGTSKRALATEAWKPLARFFFETAKHRQRVFAARAVTPNDPAALAARAPPPRAAVVRPGPHTGSFDERSRRRMVVRRVQRDVDRRPARGARPRRAPYDPHRPPGQAGGSPREGRPAPARDDPDPLRAATRAARARSRGARGPPRRRRQAPPQPHPLTGINRPTSIDIA